MEIIEVEAKINRQGGGLSVQCPRCLAVYAGNALEFFYERKFRCLVGMV